MGIKKLDGTEEVPLPIVSEHRIGLAERYELLSRLWVFVHVRMVLLAQLEEGGRLNHRIMCVSPNTELGGEGRTYLVECRLQGART